MINRPRIRLSFPNPNQVAEFNKVDNLYSWLQEQPVSLSKCVFSIWDEAGRITDLAVDIESIDTVLTTVTAGWIKYLRCLDD